MPAMTKISMDIKQTCFVVSGSKAFYSIFVAILKSDIKVILVSPTNHQSLQAEHGIKSLSGLFVKHLATVWSWHSVLPYSMLYGVNEIKTGY